VLHLLQLLLTGQWIQSHVQRVPACCSANQPRLEAVLISCRSGTLASMCITVCATAWLRDMLLQAQQSAHAQCGVHTQHIFWWHYACRELG
jgi:putative effector of murein hydrolase LrgA (UPF0299 family)